MDYKNNIKKHFIKNKKGFAMLLVMSFMLTSAMLGSSVVYMSHKQTETTGIFYAKRTAEEAAVSAGDWFAGAIEDYTSINSNRSKIVEWLNNFDNNTNTKWYNGNSDLSLAFTVSSIKNASTINISNKNINAKVKIESYDGENNIITIKVVGFGIDNSKKTMHFVYKLEGMRYDVITGTDFLGAYLTYGFSAGRGFYSNKPFTVKNSGAYIGDDPATTSVMHMDANVDGDVKIMNTKEFTIDQGFNCNGNLYINGDVVFNYTGNFGSDSSDYIFINGSALFNQSINFNNKTYLMDLNSNVGQNLTFNKEAYIKDNGATWNKTAYFNANSEIYSSQELVTNGNPSFVIASGKELKTSNHLKSDWMRTRINGTLNENIGSMENLNKEDVLSPDEYSSHEEIDIDYQKMRDLVDNENKGIRLSNLASLPVGWDQDGDGKLDADDVDYLYKNNIIGKSSTGVLTIIADDNDKIDFSDNAHGTLDAGVQVAIVVDDNNMGYDNGSDWNMWKTTMQATSEESNNENSANLGVFVSEQGSLFETNMIVDDFRGIIHDEYNSLYFNKQINMQGAFIAKQHLQSNQDVTIDYENDAIGSFYDMGIFLDPSTHNSYVPDGYDPSNAVKDSTNRIVGMNSVKPKKLFEY